jgi:uncharacterized protein YutE (UPF0331/DUF86 family)
MTGSCESGESDFSMDRDVINSKIEALRRCIQRIRDKTPESSDLLVDDLDLQDIICINLERAVQVCVDLAAHLIAESDLPAPRTMAESFDHLRRLKFISDRLAARMKKAVGFRNIAVHAYQDINWIIVYSIITTRLNDFVEYASAIDNVTQI